MVASLAIYLGVPNSMDTSDRRIMLVIFIVPFASLLYCALVVGAMLMLPIVKVHPLVSGGIAALIPLVLGATLWLVTSAQAYARPKSLPKT